MPSGLSDRIAAAITSALAGRIKVDPVEAARITTWNAATLAQIATTPGDPTPFRVVARRRTVIELEDVGRQAPGALAGLHALAIQAIAESAYVMANGAHVMRGDLAANPEMAKDASEAALIWLAERTDAELPEPDMKPTNRQAEAFGMLVAGTYERLTGRPAHHGPKKAGFVVLLDKVGIAAGLRLGDTDGLAQKVASLRKKAKANSSDLNRDRWSGPKKIALRPKSRG